MPQLTLRREFQRRRLKGTAIELANSSNSGATQVSAAEFLEITYPSADALSAIEAVTPDQGRPLVLIGARGQGKSHLMALLHHSFTDHGATRAWLETWGSRLGNSSLGAMPLREGMKVISESLHRQNYKFLWDLVFERHPYGPEVRGMWKGLGEKKTDVPSYDHLLALFKHTPTVLILDEFQTWYDGLTNTKQYPWRSWAFNFVQLLSEITKEYPELLVLVVSVRDGGSDAFQQIQRVGPILVDFKGPTGKRDRQRLLLHRLFENRMQFPDSQVELSIDVHLSEYLRLLKVPASEHESVRRRFIECWPYAPHLMQLLEDQVLVATQAQETRDLIRILAELFKRNKSSLVITAADFCLDDPNSGIVALLDSVSNQHHADLREKAQRNLSAVLDAVENPASDVPHLSEIVAALWLRSLAVGNMAGAEPEILQVDITRDYRVDDNQFAVELSLIEENSFNIHQDRTRLLFREEENPQAKLIANARNEKLFTNGSDRQRLSKEVRYAISGQSGVSQAFRVVVLPSKWSSAPWESVEDADKPQDWDQRIPFLVLPVSLEALAPILGRWLRDHLQTRRNAVRFLLPKVGATDIFHDNELLILSRAVVLAEQWSTQSHEYGKLLTKYQRELQGILSKRFDRFAILDTWNFHEPEKCAFHVEAHKSVGSNIPSAVDSHIRTNLFIPEDFEMLVGAAADSNKPLGELLRELQEPRSAGDSCVPWLGETEMKERVIRMCTRGDIAINVRGMEYLQMRTGEGEEAAWMRMRGKLGTGKHLDETYLLRPQAIPQTGGVSTPPSAPDTADETSGGKKKTSEENGKELGGETATPHYGGSTIFQGASEVVDHSSDATSALNLLGKVESWGIGTGSHVQDMSIRVSSLTGGQLDKLLRALPDGIKYELHLKKETK